MLEREMMQREVEALYLHGSGAPGLNSCFCPLSDTSALDFMPAFEPRPLVVDWRRLHWQALGFKTAAVGHYSKDVLTQARHPHMLKTWDAYGGREARLGSVPSFTFQTRSITTSKTAKESGSADLTPSDAAKSPGMMSQHDELIQASEHEPIKPGDRTVKSNSVKESDLKFLPFSVEALLMR